MNTEIANGLAFVVTSLLWFAGFTISVLNVLLTLYIKIKYKKAFAAFETVFLGGGAMMGMSYMYCNMCEINFNDIINSFFEKDVIFSFLVCIILFVLFIYMLEKRVNNGKLNDNMDKSEGE